MRNFKNIPSWFADLEDHYSDKQLKENRICPHRGADLSTFTPDADGCITCPLHGLKWHVETGKLVRRDMKDAPTETMEVYR